MDSWLVIVICIPISIICFVIFGKKAGQRMPSLRGKHVVITGGSRGIGFAIAMEVLEEGGYVTLISNSSSQIDDAISDIAQQGKYSLDKVCTKVADVGDYESISTAIKECYEWRPFDVVICNAGIARIGYMDEINITDVDSIIRTNLSGVVYTVHSSLPLMKQRSSKSNSVLGIKAVAAGKLAECQETILVLSKQLKALACPVDSMEFPYEAEKRAEREQRYELDAPWSPRIRSQSASSASKPENISTTNGRGRASEWTSESGLVAPDLYKVNVPDSPIVDYLDGRLTMHTFSDTEESSPAGSPVKSTQQRNKFTCFSSGSEFPNSIKTYGGESLTSSSSSSSLASTFFSKSRE